MHLDTATGQCGPRVACMPDFCFCIAFTNMHDAKLECEVFRVSMLYFKFYVIHILFCVFIIFSLRFECRAL